MLAIRLIKVKDKQEIASFLVENMEVSKARMDEESIVK